MGDLIKSQIEESCKLALPEGLKELMSDISREVLRTQPQHLYQFIADYLEALLRARETLSIACQVCAETCECTCELDLFTELRDIGLNEDDAVIAVEIIEKHLNGDSVKEQNLLSKLIRKTSLEESQVLDVLEVVQRAFKRRLMDGDKLGATEPVVFPLFKKREVSVSSTVYSTSLAESWTYDAEILNESPEKSDADTITQDMDYGKVKINSEVRKEDTSNESEAYYNNETESCNNESDNHSLVNEEIEEVDDINDSECSVEEMIPELMNLDQDH